MFVHQNIFTLFAVKIILLKIGLFIVYVDKYAHMSTVVKKFKLDNLYLEDDPGKKLFGTTNIIY